MSRLISGNRPQPNTYGLVLGGGGKLRFGKSVVNAFPVAT